MAPSFAQSRLVLACEPSAVRYAREHARDISKRWNLPLDMAGDCVLIIDELVANAVRHAGGGAEPFDPAHEQPELHWCSLTMWISARQVVIAVSDESQTPPVLRPPSAEAEDGRGLHLVAGLTDGQWGFQLTAGQPGKLVWAKLRLASTGSPFKGTAEGNSGGNHTQSLRQTPAVPLGRAMDERCPPAAAVRRHASTW